LVILEHAQPACLLPAYIFETAIDYMKKSASSITNNRGNFSLLLNVSGYEHWDDNSLSIHWLKFKYSKDGA
jgi:hypothetical protein